MEILKLCDEAVSVDIEKVHIHDVCVYIYIYIYIYIHTHTYDIYMDMIQIWSKRKTSDVQDNT